MDYEKDSLDTPRIVAVVSNRQPVGYLGIIRRDAVMVREFKLEPGKAYYISTYERNRPCDGNIDTAFDATDAESAAAYVVSGGVFADFTNAVTSTAAIADGDGYKLAVKIED
jgi:IMP cyclohydrolase